MAVTIGSLCSGYGGLELAVQAALGGSVVWHSEVDDAASRVLEHRWPGVPNLGDMTKVNWSAVEPVAVLAGGTPCQDVSAAGPRHGMRAGNRSGLWSAMADAIDVLRPRLVVWENVRGVLSAGADSAMEPCPGCMGDHPIGHSLRALGRVLGDLADLRYDAGWVGLRAADVGAPHNRFRVFVVAWDTESLVIKRGRPLHGLGAGDSRTVGGSGRSVAEDTDRAARDQRGIAASGQAESGRSRPDAGGRGRAPVADPDGDTVRLESVAQPGGSDPAFTGGRGPAPAVTDRDGRGQLGRVEPDERDADGRDGALTVWGPYESAIRRWERVTGRAAPPPRIRGQRGGEQLSPRFVEWMMGLPDGHVSGVPGLSRTDQLRMLGNGVVPQQGAAAINHLLRG